MGRGNGEPGPCGADETGAHQGGADETGAHQGGADETGAHQGGADETGAHQGGADETGAHQGGADKTGAGALQGRAGTHGRDWDLEPRVAMMVQGIPWAMAGPGSP